MRDVSSLRFFLTSSLFRTAGVYGGLNIVRQLIPFFLLPVITRYLTPADYGVLAMFNVLTAFIYVLISLGLDAAIGREYFERDRIDFPNYVMNCLGAGVVCALALIPVVYFLGPLIERYSGVPVMLLWVVLAIGFCRFVTQILLVIWQSGARAWSYSAVLAGQSAVDAGLTLYFIILLGMGLRGRIDAIFYAAAVFAVIAAICLWRGGWLKTGYNRKYLRMACAMGIPIIPHALGGLIISMTDRILLMNMLGATETGYYFIGFQIGNVLGMAVLAFNQAWNPWLFQKLKDGRDSGLIVRFTYVYFIILLAVASCITFITPWVFRYLIGDSFLPGIPVVAWAAFGAVFTGMYYIVSGYIIYTRKTHILSALTMLSGIVNVAASYILIRMNGYVGAAQGFMIANALMFFLAWYLAMKVYPMPWSLRMSGTDKAQHENK